MSGTQELQKVLDLFEQRIAAVESKVGVAGPPPPPAASSGGGAPQVTAFDAYCTKSLEPFVAACAALNAKEATECAEHVKQAWSAMRGFIVAASVSKKPANFPGDCMALIKPCQEAMQGASKAISRGDWELHQKTVSEGVQCLSWLITSPGPKDVVESYIGGTDFHANKIRVKYKKTNQKQIAFCDTFKRLMTDLMAYVKEYHLTGVTFNPRGGDIGSAPVTAAKENTPPPAAQTSAKAGLASALAGLQNANDLQSKGLRKVTKDQQTWRKEFSGGEKPAVVAQKKAPVRKQNVTKGPPSKKLLGKKWMVENYSKQDGVVTIEVEPKFTVYIACCYEATLVISGKCNGVVLDASQKCQVVFDTCIASFEVVNCKSVKVQCKGTCPSIAIDKTDGILTYLSKETLPVTSFLTSKSSDMQVSFPNDSGDMVEAPVPEQFRHTAALVGGKPVLSTDVSDLYTH